MGIGEMEKRGNLGWLEGMQPPNPHPEFLFVEILG